MQQAVSTAHSAGTRKATRDGLAANVWASAPAPSPTPRRTPSRTVPFYSKSADRVVSRLGSGLFQFAMKTNWNVRRVYQPTLHDSLDSTYHMHTGNHEQFQEENLPEDRMEAQMAIADKQAHSIRITPHRRREACLDIFKVDGGFAGTRLPGKLLEEAFKRYKTRHKDEDMPFDVDGKDKPDSFKAVETQEDLKVIKPVKTALTTKSSKRCWYGCL